MISFPFSFLSLHCIINLLIMYSPLFNHHLILVLQKCVYSCSPPVFILTSLYHNHFYFHIQSFLYLSGFIIYIYIYNFIFIYIYNLYLSYIYQDCKDKALRKLATNKSWKENVIIQEMVNQLTLAMVWGNGQSHTLLIGMKIVIVSLKKNVAVHYQYLHLHTLWLSNSPGIKGKRRL